jgi:hypothetical protein
VAQVTIEHGELIVRDALEQVAVVRDNEQGARPGVEQVLHRNQHVGVEVVRWLVENQHVRLVQENENS